MDETKPYEPTRGPNDRIDRELIAQIAREHFPNDPEGQAEYLKALSGLDTSLDNRYASEGLTTHDVWRLPQAGYALDIQATLAKVETFAKAIPQDQKRADASTQSVSKEDESERAAIARELLLRIRFCRDGVALGAIVHKTWH